MGEQLSLISPYDGATIPADLIPARGAQRGGLMLIQEIFGVNANILALAERFAGDGFDVLCPHFFARIRPGFTAGYDAEGIAAARAAADATPFDQAVGDAQAAIDALAARGAGPVFAAGFCWGGSLAWAAAAGCTGLTAAAGFYGRMIVTLLDHAPRCPIILHYGDRDALIPLADIDRVRAAFPAIPVHVYPAGHGFFSDRSADHDPTQADLSWAGTLAFFAANAAPG